MKKISGLHFLMLGVIPFVSCGSKPEVEETPNIIFFYIDDLGWKDLSCYGSEFYETPAIDELANDGVRFTSAYQAAARCVPSRTSLFTGKYHERKEIADSKGVVLEEYTFAEALRDGGYRTFFTGKWHLGKDSTRYPDKQGFDVNVAGCDWGAPNGDSGGGGRYFSPYGCPTLTDGPEGEYLTDRLTQETIDFIKKHNSREPSEPFLACIFHYAVHTPIEAPDKYIDPYREKLKTMEYELPVREIDGPAKTKLRQDHAVYAGMITGIDESVRKIRETLEELNLHDNTIIIFSTDHGGLSTTLKSNGREIATSNYPLRTGKGWLYEGGIRSPLIIYWPGITEAGSITDEPVVNTDFYPTMLEMAGLELRPEQHLDGESFASLLKGKKWTRSKPIMWYFPKAKRGTGNPNMAAVRKDNYKLIHFMYQNRFELYDLENDLSESHNLAEELPDVANEYMDLLLQIEKETNMPSLTDYRINEEVNYILPEYPIGIMPSDYPEMVFLNSEMDEQENIMSFELEIREENENVHPVNLHFYYRNEDNPEWTEIYQIEGNRFRLLPGTYSCSWNYSDFEGSVIDLKIQAIIHNKLYPVKLKDHILEGLQLETPLAVIDKHFKTTIYPNPASTAFNLKSEQEIENILISDIAGNELVSIAGEGKKLFSIPLAELVDGVYIISIKNINSSLREFRKLIIRR